MKGVTRVGGGKNMNLEQEQARLRACFGGKLAEWVRIALMESQLP